jgi:hypothetical protein
MAVCSLRLPRPREGRQADAALLRGIFNTNRLKYISAAAICARYRPLSFDRCGIALHYMTSAILLP